MLPRLLSRPRESAGVPWRLLLFPPLALVVTGSPWVHQQLFPMAPWELEQLLEERREVFLIALPALTLLLIGLFFPSRGTAGTGAKGAPTLSLIALWSVVALEALVGGHALTLTAHDLSPHGPLLEGPLLLARSALWTTTLIFVVGSARLAGRGRLVSLSWGLLGVAACGFATLAPRDLLITDASYETYGAELLTMMGDLSLALEVTTLSGWLAGSVALALLCRRSGPLSFPRWLGLSSAAAALGVVAVGGAMLLVLAPLARDPVSDQEVEEVLAWIDEAIDDNGDRSCPRAVLRGPPLGGSGSEALYDLVADDGPLAPCLDAVADEDLFEALSGRISRPRPERRWSFSAIPERPAEGEEEQEIAQRRWLLTTFGAPPYPPGERPLALDRAIGACQELPAAVADVVAHEEICSPWLPGLRPMTIEDSRRLRLLASTLAAMARARAGEGDDEGALSLLLDGARLFMDARRGPAPIATALGADSAEAVVMGELQTLLSLERLTDETLRRALAELDLLAATSPTLGEAVAGDTLLIALYDITPSIRQGWHPPGGWIPDQETFPVEPLVARAYLVSLYRLIPTLAAACPPDVSALSCLEQLQRHEDTTPLARPLLDSWLLNRRITMEQAERVVRRQILDIYLDLLPSLAAMPGRAEALSAWVEHRLLSSSCPGVEDTTLATVGDRLEASALGAPLWLRVFPVQGTGYRELELQAPLSLAQRSARPRSLAALLALSARPPEDAPEQLLPLIRVLCPPVPALGEWRLIHPETGEPAVEGGYSPLGGRELGGAP